MENLLIYLIVTFMCFMTIRILWINHNIIGIIENNFDEYLNLESPPKMLIQFWVWNFKKFVKN